MSYDWAHSTRTEANIPETELIAEGTNYGAADGSGFVNPYGGGTTPNHAADCPCPGHTCSGDIAVGAYSGTFTQEQTVIYYVSPGGAEDHRTTSTQTAHLDAVAHALRYSSAGDCWPTITITATVFGSGFYMDEFGAIFNGSDSVAIDPLTDARAYTVTDSGTRTDDDGGTLIQTIRVHTWSYSVRYAVHAGLL